MKHLIIITLSVFFVQILMAQPNKRVAAYNYLKYGEIDKAKENIDDAVKNEKTMNDPKTWWYYGQIYHQIQIQKAYKQLDNNAAQKALEGYKKALVLNFKDPANQGLDIVNNEDDQVKFLQLLMNQKTTYVDDQITMDIILNQFPSMANIFVNKGVTEYKDNQDYANALKSFESSLFLSGLAGKVDTPIIYYAAMAAEKSKKYTEAIKYYDLVTKMGYGANPTEKASMYFLMAETYEAKGDTGKYVDCIKKGIEKYPDGSALLVTNLINYYLKHKQIDEAFNYLKLAIKKEDKNANLYQVMGSIYDLNLQKPDSAIFYYKKAIELKPDYLDAHYNLGALYYNKGADINNQANDEKDFKKSDALLAKAKENFGLAIPYFEKAHELDATDLNIVRSLKELYYRTGNTAKYEEMKAILDKK